jgi:hypothetical protein
MTDAKPPIIESFDLASLERLLCTEAIRAVEGNLKLAAKLLGLTRYALRRRIEKREIPWCHGGLDPEGRLPPRLAVSKPKPKAKPRRARAKARGR